MKFLLLLFLLISINVLAQTDPFLEKLGVSDKAKPSNISSKTIDKLNKTAKDSLYLNSDKAERYARIAGEFSKKKEYAKGEIEAYLVISSAKIYLNQVDSALLYANAALAKSKQFHSNHFIVKSYEMQGNVHLNCSRFEKATKSYFSAIRVAEKNDKKDAVTSYSNLGLLYMKIGNSEKSKDYCTKAYKLSKQYQDTSTLISAINNLGILAKNANDLPTAINYYEEGLALAEKTRNFKRISEIAYNLGNIYFKMDDEKKGNEYYDKSLSISKNNKNYSSTAVGYHGLAYNYYNMGKLSKAIEAGNTALDFALMSSDYEIKMETFILLAQLERNNGNSSDAYTYMTHAFAYKDSINLLEMNEAVYESETAYKNEKIRYADSLEKIQIELDAANTKKLNEAKVKFRDILLIAAAIVLILVLITLYYLKKNNRIIHSKNLLVEKQKHELEKQHGEIKDSITYAKRIQDAIISKENIWKQTCEEHFIFFKPKDVVSGDFYWVHHDNVSNISVWAVADCTGHGVPGAFMSMLGIGLLNELIIENSLTDPGEVLNRLRSKIISALQNESSESTKDGMDISLCVWSHATRTLSYAGANNPLWIITKEESLHCNWTKNTISSERGDNYLHEIVPDKMPIGVFLSQPPPFQTKIIQLPTESTIVLFSDGYADQFGGDHGKKYKYLPLKEQLLELNDKKFIHQKEKLEQTLISWQRKEEQVDDICIVGIKL